MIIIIKIIMILIIMKIIMLMMMIMKIIVIMMIMVMMMIICYPCCEKGVQQDVCVKLAGIGRGTWPRLIPAGFLHILFLSFLSINLYLTNTMIAFLQNLVTCFDVYLFQ